MSAKALLVPGGETLVGLSGLGHLSNHKATTRSAEGVPSLVNDEDDYRARLAGHSAKV